MVKSMTGFGRCETADENRKFTVEMKSVNHRYFDVNIRMPKKLMSLETAVRNLLKKYIERGKVDVFINYEDLSQNSAALTYNQALAAEYIKVYSQIEQDFSIENDVTVSMLGKCPEVVTMEEQPVDEETLWKLLEEAVEGACRQFVESRVTEGERLKSDMLEKLTALLEGVDYIENHSPSLIEEYRARLEAKIQEVLGDVNIDESRLATEVTIYADKICVDEETVRLRSHILSTKEALEKGGSVGKRLDFIAQEMNREANTILSKANNLDITNTAITLKTEIEKIREQIQNLE